MLPYVKIIWQCIKCDTRIDNYEEFCSRGCKDNNNVPIKMREYRVYDLDPLIKDYDVNTYFIIGHRDNGKSHKVASRIVERWEKYQEKAILIRRFEKTEFNTALDIFKVFGYKFDKKGVYIEVEDTEFLDDEEDYSFKKGKKSKTRKEKVYFVYLHSIFQAGGIKGSQYKAENVTTLFWDEYTPENGKFYPDEIDWFRSLQETVFRRRTDYKVFVVCNNSNRFLPLLVDARINWDQDITYDWKRKIVAHIINSENYTKATGGVVDYSKGSKYHDYAYKNKDLYLQDQYIEKHKIELIPYQFATKLGVMDNVIIGKFWVDDYLVLDYTEEIIPYSVIDEYHYIRTRKKPDKKIIDLLQKKYMENKILFTLPEIKNAFYKYIKMLI